MKILAIGDVIGSPGRTYLKENLQEIKKEYNTSISIGYATADKLPVDFLQLIKEADQQMYQKKNQRKKDIF